MRGRRAGVHTLVESLTAVFHPKRSNPNKPIIGMEHTPLPFQRGDDLPADIVLPLQFDGIK
jgi:hypothetical protein